MPPHPTIRPQPGILDIAPYMGGDSRLAGHDNVLKLSSNENPYGPSPHAIEALRGTSDILHLYPGTDHAGLRMAISRSHDIPVERVICGVGSDEILAFLCFCYAGAGDEVIHTEHGFAMYRISALGAGATPVEVAETERQTDIDKILAACNDRTRVVFVTNPGNPTGTLIPGEALTRLAEGLPEQALLVIDGAYAEYVGPEYGDPALDLVAARDNVVMTRTFSKIYGLGGLRVGWAFGPDHVIDALNRIRGPFNLSTPALAAAEAAVADQAHMEQCRAQNARNRAWLAKALAAVGVPSDPSHANFILARFGAPSQAEACDAHLRRDGIIVRRVAGYKLPDALRITIGDQSACERVAASISAFMKGISA